MVSSNVAPGRIPAGAPLSMVGIFRARVRISTLTPESP
jgi:hypothetical protein